jgi:1,4-alpha-glucan branching enzyme
MKRQQVKKGKGGRRRVEFRFHDPRARAVSVVGDFNGWDPALHPLRRNGDGAWTRIAFILPGRYEYRFLSDGRWCNDPANAVKCRNPFGSHNDVLVVGP